jgi:CheY-like chemotaxis protein
MLNGFLLIDDSEDDALLMRVAFRQAGLDEPIRHMADTDEAFAFLGGEGKYSDRDKFPLPDVIFLDLKMPKVDGFHVIKWIRSQPHLARVFLVVLTNVHDTKLIQLAYQLGANSFLSKQASYEEVLNFAQFFRKFSSVSNRLPRNVETKDKQESDEDGARGKVA